jgi:hypothetical protein
MGIPKYNHANDLKELRKEKPRFKETGSILFNGDYLYEQVVPAQHFLGQLK